MVKPNLDPSEFGSNQKKCLTASKQGSKIQVALRVWVDAHTNLPLPGKVVSLKRQCDRFVGNQAGFSVSPLTAEGFFVFWALVSFFNS
jgi:hypothetical protein